MTGTSPLGFLRLQGRAQAAPKPPLHPRRGCDRDAQEGGKAEGQRGKPQWLLGDLRGTSPGRVLIAQLRILLWLLCYTEDLGDLSWGRVSITLDYWDISLNISCLTGDKSGRARGHRRHTNTQQPPR